MWDRARGASTEHSLGHQRCCPAQGPSWGHSPSPRCSSAPPQLPTRNPRVPRAAEGNQSTGLKGCLENISSSLPIICLKIPINVYTYVPGRHVYPQLMARRGSWRDLCAAAPARSQPALIYSFSPHRLLLTSSNPIPITASHLPFNVNKSCVVGPLLPAQIKAVMLMEEKHNLRPARKAGRKIKHGGHRGIGGDAQSLGTMGSTSRDVEREAPRQRMAVPDEEMDVRKILWDTHAPGTSCSMYGKSAWGTACFLC